MGTFYNLICTNCGDSDKILSYGVGMMYPETHEDFHLFTCKSCGGLFDRNINKKYNRCPKCRRKPKEVKIIKNINVEFRPKLDTVIKCSNCKTGYLQIAFSGIWD